MGFSLTQFEPEILQTVPTQASRFLASARGLLGNWGIM
jgi:hypothetical protein